jgi:hypothetical protein
VVGAACPLGLDKTITIQFAKVSSAHFNENPKWEIGQTEGLKRAQLLHNTALARGVAGWHQQFQSTPKTEGLQEEWDFYKGARCTANPDSSFSCTHLFIFSRQQSRKETCLFLYNQFTCKSDTCLFVSSCPTCKLIYLSNTTEDKHKAVNVGPTLGIRVRYRLRATQDYLEVNCTDVASRKK